MNREEYIRRLEEIFQGEVLGAALFHALAGALPDPENRYKMSVLEQLEIETKELLRNSVKRLGGERECSREWSRSGNSACRNALAKIHACISARSG